MTEEGCSVPVGATYWSVSSLGFLVLECQSSIVFLGSKDVADLLWCGKSRTVGERVSMHCRRQKYTSFLDGHVMCILKILLGHSWGLCSSSFEAVAIWVSCHMHEAERLTTLS